MPDLPLWLVIAAPIIAALAALSRPIIAFARWVWPWVVRAWRRFVGLLRLDSRVREQSQAIERLVGLIEAQTGRIGALEAALLKSRPREMVEYDGVRWIQRQRRAVGDPLNDPYCPWCYEHGREMLLTVHHYKNESRRGFVCKHPGHSNQFFQHMEDGKYQWAAWQMDATPRQAEPDPRS